MDLGKLVSGCFGDARVGVPNNKLQVIKSFLVELGAARPPHLESICLINSHKATRIHPFAYRSDSLDSDDLG